MSKKPQAATAAAKPATGKITALTPAGLAELLAMTWPSQGAARMYLNRRGTTVEKLGLMYGMAEGSGVCLQERAPAAASVPAAKPAKGKKAADPFETWAANVDIQLVAAKEEPVADSVLREYFAQHRSPQEAVDRIIADRTDALERQAIEATSQAVDKAIVEAPLAKPAKAKRKPGPSVQDIVDQIVRDVEPSPESTPAIPRQPGQVFLQIGDGMERSAADLWAPKLAKQLKFSIHICDAATGKVLGSAEAKQPREPRAPRAASSSERKNDTLAVVIPLMEHETGLSGEEARAVLNWKTPPGPWYFNHWAEKAGRVADLVDMGKVDGARRFRLKTGGDKASE